jgi:hypothetical protein
VHCSSVSSISSSSLKGACDVSQKESEEKRRDPARLCNEFSQLTRTVFLFVCGRVIKIVSSMKFVRAFKQFRLSGSGGGGEPARAWLD